MEIQGLDSVSEQQAKMQKTSHRVIPINSNNGGQVYDYRPPGFKAGFRNHYWPVSLLITLSFWVSIILWAVYKDKVVAYFIIMIIIYLLDTIFNNPMKNLLAQPIQLFEQVILYQNQVIKAAPQFSSSFLTYHIQQIGKRPQRVVTNRLFYEFKYDQCTDSTKNIDDVYELMPIFIVDTQLIWNFGDDFTRKQYEEFIQCGMQSAKSKDKYVLKTEKQSLPHLQGKFLTASNKNIIPFFFNLQSLIIATFLGLSFLYKVIALSQVGYLKYKVVKSVKIYR